MSSQLINRVLELTNAERAKAGLKPLTLNNQLAEAAQGHSDSMAADDFFSHTGADGSSVGDRVKEEGYEFARTGENIAAGQTTAEQVVEGWMNSPGHRANILNADYTEIGIGYELLENDTGSVNYNRYWTQVFGKPLNNNSQVNNDVPNPTIEQNNSIDPVAVEDNSSNDLLEETPEIPVFEQQPGNPDSSKPDLAPVSEIDPVAVEDNSSNDLLEETPEIPVFEQQPGNPDSSKPDLAPVSEIDPVAVEDNSSNDLLEETPEIPVFEQQPSNSDSSKPDLAPVSEIDPVAAEDNSGNDLLEETPEIPVFEQQPSNSDSSKPDLAPVSEIDPVVELTPVEATPTIEKDPLTNNVDVNLFGMEMGDSTTPEVEEVNEDLTGGSSNLTLTGGDDIMTSASKGVYSFSSSSSSSSSGNKFTSVAGNYDLADVSEILKKSWLGTSELSFNQYESDLIESISNSNLSPSQQQKAIAVVESFF